MLINEEGCAPYLGCPKGTVGGLKKNLPGLEIQEPGPSASVARAPHLILSLSSPGKILPQLWRNSKQKSRQGKTIRSWSKKLKTFENLLHQVSLDVITRSVPGKFNYITVNFDVAQSKSRCNNKKTCIVSSIVLLLTLMGHFYTPSEKSGLWDLIL